MESKFCRDCRHCDKSNVPPHTKEEHKYQYWLCDLTAMANPVSGKIRKLDCFNARSISKTCPDAKHWEPLEEVTNEQS